MARGRLRVNLAPDHELLRSVARRRGVRGERLVRRRFRDIRVRPGPVLLSVGEQPGLYRGVRPLLLRMIVGETAGFEDYGAQLGDAAANLCSARSVC